ncbi:hypothetical protein PPACK8108_LOCUS21343 [Phakopsora pachyrhizi]|uniref:MADS-box domain-containing protein n=1 Tax=Phakopsora pachyrhizi TaxID=170000 RepID=A0AAV0BIC7_PHAPC|nr:hypothetical protein PPACK8108_LOCUS21343 [Phakopsora pachyrhizi]
MSACPSPEPISAYLPHWFFFFSHKYQRHNYSFRADELSFDSKRASKDLEDDDDDEEEDATERKKNPGRRKIDIEFIKDKGKRHITFSKRKAGIMKKAYELATLTGTQLLLLVVSETGIVYTFTTHKLQPIVTDDPGKGLISNCLNDGDSEIQIEQEELDSATVDESLTFRSGGGLEENEFLSLNSENNNSSKANEVDQVSSTPEIYQNEVQRECGSNSLNPNNLVTFYQDDSQKLVPQYETLLHPEFQEIYQMLGHQMVLPDESNYNNSTGNLQICPAGPASFLHLPQSQEIPPMGSFPSLDQYSDDRRIKRRRTEADLRDRSEGLNPINSMFLNQYGFAPGWVRDPEVMKLESAPENKTPIIEGPTLTSLATSFLLSQRAHVSEIVAQDSNNFNQLEKSISLFLDSCDSFQIGNDVSGSSRWRDVIFPDRATLAKCLRFFFTDYLSMLRQISIKFRHLQKLVKYLCFFYDAQEEATNEMVEVIQSASDSFRGKSCRVEQVPVTTNNSNLSWPGVSNQKLKTAPKLKPRKAINVNLRGGRLDNVLEEYTAWYRKNKSNRSANRGNSRVKGWFKVERVRRTFCCSSEVNVLKIRFPSSAIKLIRKGDKLELEVEQSEDGQEWNIFSHADSELYPGDESDEDDFYSVSLDKPLDDLTLEALVEQKGSSIEEIKKWWENKRIMKLQIEGGDLEDDGFESKVPPKGGKQAFRVKKPSYVGGIQVAKTESQGFDCDDKLNINLKNSPS